MTYIEDENRVLGVQIASPSAAPESPVREPKMFLTCRAHVTYAAHLHLHGRARTRPRGPRLLLATLCPRANQTFFTCCARLLAFPAERPPSPGRRARCGWPGAPRNSVRSLSVGQSSARWVCLGFGACIFLTVRFPRLSTAVLQEEETGQWTITACAYPLSKYRLSAQNGRALTIVPFLSPLKRIGTRRGGQEGPRRTTACG